ncbi:MAG: hypothetical protein AAF570_01995 [Bacteroidota bacterium]
MNTRELNVWFEEMKAEMAALMRIQISMLKIRRDLTSDQKQRQNQRLQEGLEQLDQIRPIREPEPDVFDIYAPDWMKAGLK